MKHNLFTRFLALALVLCMTLSLVGMVSATETEASATITLSATPSNDGKQIQVILGISQNPGIGSVSATLEYSGNVTYNSHSSSIISDVHEASDNGGSIGYQAMSTGDAVTTTGTLAVFVFDVTSNSGVATFSLSKCRVYDAEDNNVSASLPGAKSVDLTVRYNVTASAGSNGTVSVSSTSAAEGETITITATPNSGYEIDTITAKTGSTNVTLSGSGNTRTFTMPAGAVTVNATFKAITYTVTVGSTTNGTVKASASSAAAGSTVTLTATPNSGCALKTIAVKDASGNAVTLSGSGNTRTFKMPAGNVTVSASFEVIPTYNVTVSAATNGTVKASATSKITEGTTVKLTVTPETGYNLKSLTVKDASGKTISTTGSYSFTMPASNVTVSATFEKASYTITSSVGKNGTASVDKTKAGYGETITVTAKANDDYQISGVKVTDADGKTVKVTEKGDKYTFTMPASNVKVAVTFVGESYSIKTGSVENGTIAVSGSGAYGSTVNFTVTPDEGYKIASVKVTNANGKELTVSGGSGSYSFTMPNSKVTITAVFEAEEYGITTEPAENGSFTLDAENANMGTVVTVTTAPEEGYQVNSLTITDAEGNLVSYETVTEGETYTFVMPNSDVSVAVLFEEIPTVTYKVTVSETENGTVSLSKDEAGAASIVTVTAAPDAGYKVATVEVVDANGTAIEVTGSENVYTFEMPEADATVSVTFEEDPGAQAEEPEEEGNNGTMLIWILSIAVLLIVIAVVVIILLLRKKKD